MKKIPVIITVEGGICQSVDSPQALDVLVLDFDKGADEYLSCSTRENDPKDWQLTRTRARQSMENEGKEPNEYETLSRKIDTAKSLCVTVKWGSDGTITETYNFNTQVELEAFLYGCHEGNGWLEYEIIEEPEIQTP